MNDPRRPGAGGNPVTDHIDLWTSALLVKSAAGRGSNSRSEAYGIKRLRELILELAVRGKLVPQNPNDESASELLKRIRAEKAKLITAGKIKKGKPLPSIADEDIIFGLPNGWAYSNLGDVVEIVRGITFPGNEKSKVPEHGRIACLRTSNVQDQIEWGDILYIREEFVAREDQFIKPHDIVMSMANSRELVGKVALVGEEVKQKTTFGGFLGVLRPFLIEPRFVMVLLRTPHSREMLIDSASQTTNIANVSLAKLRPLFFAIPPLAEQRRIVAKVDELMVLCDQLEQQQGHGIEAHQTLVETLLGTLTNVESAQEFAAAWNRIAEHFDTLFTTEHSIDQLKQTILQLAVMGKLVSQDLNDETADQLLARIEQAPKRFMRTRSVTEDEGDLSNELVPLFELPAGWEWAPFGRLPLQASVGIDRGRAMQGADKEFGYFKMNNIRNSGGVDLSDLTRIDATPDEVRIFKLASGDFLFNTRNSRELVGKTCVFKTWSDQPILYNNNILRARFIDGFSPDFLDYWFRSPPGSAELEKLKSNTTNVCAIYQGKLFAFPCPIPPLAEQHRIVAKVDELMALCDTLKARLAEAQTTQIRLADAIFERAVAEPELSAA